MRALAAKHDWAWRSAVEQPTEAVEDAVRRQCSRQGGYVCAAAANGTVALATTDPSTVLARQTIDTLNGRA